MKGKLYRTAVPLPNGKRKWISSTTKEGLDKKKKELLLQISAGTDVLSDTTFEEYAELWFRVYKEPYLRPKSIETLRTTFNTHIAPYLGSIPLKKVTPMQIQMILGNMADLSKSLNDKVVQILRGIFNAAVDNNLISKSPVPVRLRSGGVATKEKAALTVEQSKQLLNAVFGTRAYLFCLIALQTGMRRGEICGLMWEDIDFDAQVIHVTHNAVFTNAQTVVSNDLKTSAARRDIPIPPTLLAVLTGAQKDNASPFVLHMNNGKPLSQTSFSNLWDMVRRRTVDDAADLGKPARNSKMIRSLDFHVTPHQLRHTYITRLFESGLDIKEIQYLAGHSTVDMTLRVYTHYQHESRKKKRRRRSAPHWAESQVPTRCNTGATVLSKICSKPVSKHFQTHIRLDWKSYQRCIKFVRK